MIRTSPSDDIQRESIPIDRRRVAPLMSLKPADVTFLAHRPAGTTPPGRMGEDWMRRTGLSLVAVAAITIVTVIGGASKTKGTKAPVSEEPAGRTGGVGTGGAGANLNSDGDFVHDVAIKNMAEIELSRMALEKATSPDIKSFAQTMINDHGAAGDKLKSVVSGHSIEWPAQLDEKHWKKADGRGKKQGADVDRDYVKAMVDGHQDLAAKLESRLDVHSLADWKNGGAGHHQNKGAARARAAQTE